jgi:hypothetical protein
MKMVKEKKNPGKKNLRAPFPYPAIEMADLQWYKYNLEVSLF